LRRDDDGDEDDVRGGAADSGAYLTAVLISPWFSLCLSVLVVFSGGWICAYLRYLRFAVFDPSSSV
jgi:hypothetical protein